MSVGEGVEDDRHLLLETVQFDAIVHPDDMFIDRLHGNHVVSHCSPEQAVVTDVCPDVNNPSIRVLKESLLKNPRYVRLPNTRTEKRRGNELVSVRFITTYVEGRHRSRSDAFVVGNVVRNRGSYVVHVQVGASVLLRRDVYCQFASSERNGSSLQRQVGVVVVVVCARAVIAKPGHRREEPDHHVAETERKTCNGITLISVGIRRYLEVCILFSGFQPITLSDSCGSYVWLQLYIQCIYQKEVGLRP